MNFKSLIPILILMFVIMPAISAENATAQNTHNTDINDTKYITQNDYYFDENKTRITYTSDTGSFNNVSMSNGYNAYAIQDGGYIETNDSKTHPSFWNDTYYIVDANDTQTVAGHWHYADRKPIGEYLKILFFTHYDDLIYISPNPNVPSSIFVQSMVWDFYKNGNDIDGLYYEYNKEAVTLYDNGYRVNNTGNVQWINETAYRIFDFLGFKNIDPTHKDLWGFRVSYFNKTMENNSYPPNNGYSVKPPKNNTTNKTQENKTTKTNTTNKTQENKTTKTNTTNKTQENKTIPNELSKTKKRRN